MATITDSWADIKSAIINGTFSYVVGDTKQFTYGDGTNNHTVQAEVRKIDTTNKCVHFVLKDFDETVTYSNLLTRIATIYSSELPSDLKDVLINTKKVYVLDTAGTKTTSILKLWALSCTNTGVANYSYSREREGDTYYISADNDSRKKENQNTGLVDEWWTATYSDTTGKAVYIYTSGAGYNANTSGSKGLIFGFCVGKEPNTRDLMGDQACLDALVAHSLTEFIDDTVVKLGAYAFYENTNLESVDLPSCTQIGTNAFTDCTKLKSANIPSATKIDYRAFYGCTKLESIYLPALQGMGLGNDLFRDCSTLQVADVGSSITSLSTRMFQGCSSLTTLIIRTTSQVVNYGTNALSGANNAIIYVPDALVDTYKESSSWSGFSSRIKGLSELPS